MSPLEALLGHKEEIAIEDYTLGDAQYLFLTAGYNLDRELDHPSGILKPKLESTLDTHPFMLAM
eukprot:11427579-Ditylum_brightwellii.AAC.1